jgi:hypothetical protein
MKHEAQNVLYTLQNLKTNLQGKYKRNKESFLRDLMQDSKFEIILKVKVKLSL